MHQKVNLTQNTKKMLSLTNKMLAYALTVLVAVSSATGQRTSPQFTFTSPAAAPLPTSGNQFGTDPFGLSNQQSLSLLNSQASQQGNSNSAGQIQPSFVALGTPPVSPQLQSLLSPPETQQFTQPPQQPQLVSQSPSQSQQTRPEQQLGQSHQPSRQTLSQSNRNNHHQTTSSTSVSTQRSPVPSTNQHTTSVSSSTSTSSASPSSSSAANQRSSNPQQHTSVESARKFEANSASLAASSGQSFNCPDSFGFFRHPKSCDKYWACENGTATLKLCGNGLMFDDSDPKRENCAYPFSVECGSDRTDLEPPISTPNCPRLYGLFSDSSNCRVFYSCWNGEASKYECPPGLAYDSDQRVCVWADLVDRCDQSEVSDGFVCPDPTEADQPGHYTRHAHPTDCRKFYVCIDNVARPYGCSFGSVFNVDSLQCDEPENVSGCEKYYGDLDPKLAKKLARENAQQSGNFGTSAPASRSTSTSVSRSSSASST